MRPETDLAAAKARGVCHGGSSAPACRLRLRLGRGFDPRPCARGDAATPTVCAFCGAFRSAPLREGRHSSFSCSAAARRFDPRPCARGDSAPLRRPAAPVVSIRAPARGATRPARCGVGLSRTFRSAPLREGRPVGPAPDIVPSHVSIRAPARGATTDRAARNAASTFRSAPLREGRRVARPQAPGRLGFRSAPLREGRHRPAHDGEQVGGFRSAPLREGRLVGHDAHIVGQFVSIRAPARGATLGTAPISVLDDVFRSAPLREGRPSPPERDR